MDRRDERKKEAAKHLGLVRGVFADDTKSSIESATIYEEGEGRMLSLGEPRYESTNVDVRRTQITRALQHATGKVCAVDAASYRHPGGNYENGGWGCEEVLCSESNLYCVLEGLKSTFYHDNRETFRGGLFSDRAAYVSDIVFTSGGGMQKRDVLVCAPPMRKQALENHRSEIECDVDLKARIEAVLTIAATHEIDTLVASDFGCGYMGNDPQMVAETFKAWLDAHPGMFQTVVFAIPGGPAVEVFQNVFGVSSRPREAQREREQRADNENKHANDEDEWSTDVSASSDGHWVFGPDA